MLRSRSARPPSRTKQALRRLLKGTAILTGLLALGVLSGYVAMLLSVEPDLVGVPRVIGVESVAAGEILKEAGLTPRIIAEEFSSHLPKGHVTSQRPAGGSRLKIGSEVRLIRSRGSDQLAVPDVRGQELPQAQRTLMEAGLTVGGVIQIHSDAHPREVVIGQDPAPGAPAVRGNRIVLLGSIGPLDNLVVVPDLRGREMVTALNLLKELQVEARVSFRQEASAQGHVIAQEPAPGGKVRVGGQVELTIGE
ncbi:MAG: PASTA domain-containing protein [candidate division NC10 bacterium]|nr:PASTA domain-containing protein [candidate division NC10 bacterium]